MHISQKVLPQHSQGFVLSASMRQAIELLELSHIDLQTYVEQQVMENPFLEIDSYAGNNDPNNETIHEEKSIDESYENTWHSSEKSKILSNDFGSLNHIEAKSPSLKEHILSQINVSFIKQEDRAIAALVIDYLEDTGYLVTTIDIIAKELNISIETLNTIITTLKSFEPCGIFASNLYECLSVQLQERDLWDATTQSVLENISLFADAKIGLLQKKCNCTEDDLYEVLEKIKMLNPKPAMAFNTKEPIIHVVPDVFVNIVNNSSTNNHFEWTVRLNNEVLPKVLINNDYIITNNVKDKKLRKYYQDRMSSANFLIKAIDSRAQNTLKVAQEIIKYQQGFFQYGINKLQPMTLKQIAKLTDLHESTVSRITQNKYIGCSRGTIAMKYFFHSTITNNWNGDSQSTLHIQYQIKELIKNENPDQPLSDDQIVKALSYSELDVARRTVAKYRDLLKIPTSYERKKRYL